MPGSSARLTGSVNEEFGALKALRIARDATGGGASRQSRARTRHTCVGCTTSTSSRRMNTTTRRPCDV